MLNLRKFSHTSPKLCYLHLCNSLTIKCPLFRQGRKNWWEKLVKQNTMLICYKKKLWEIFNYVWARLVDLLLVYPSLVCLCLILILLMRCLGWMNFWIKAWEIAKRSSFFHWGPGQLLNLTRDERILKVHNKFDVGFNWVHPTEVRSTNTFYSCEAYR